MHVRGDRVAPALFGALRRAKLSLWFESHQPVSYDCAEPTRTRRPRLILTDRPTDRGAACPRTRYTLGGPRTPQQLSGRDEPNRHSISAV